MHNSSWNNAEPPSNDAMWPLAVGKPFSSVCFEIGWKYFSMVHIVWYRNFLFSKSHVLCKQNSFRKHCSFYCFVTYKGKPRTLFFWNGSFKNVCSPPSRQIASFKLLQCKKSRNYHLMGKCRADEPKAWLLSFSKQYRETEILLLIQSAILNSLRGPLNYKTWNKWYNLNVPNTVFLFFSYSTRVTRALHILGMYPNTKFYP